MALVIGANNMLSTFFGRGAELSLSSHVEIAPS
jgi:hypothetical protein